MRYTLLLPLAGVCTAFVLPDQQVFSSLVIEDTNQPSTSSKVLKNFNDAWQSAEQSVTTAYSSSRDIWENALSHAQELASALTPLKVPTDPTQIDFSEEDKNTLDTLYADYSPQHGHHSHKPNRTVYELINESKYTTKLAELINEDKELVKLLNSTTANFTVFAPTDSAFAKIPKHHKKPSKEFIKELLTYHVSTEFYPAGRVLVSRTIPTALGSEYLGGEQQRLSTQISLRGLTVNFYARIVAVNIFGTNGVIHGLDSILFPPPKTTDVLSFLPAEFSTLELGLLKTGLFDLLNDTSTHVGGTLFAPSNGAFSRLGPKITGFLFSKYGEKYLKALLQYHFAPNFTLYSDALYKGTRDGQELAASSHSAGIPKGVFHVDLPTLLEARSLSIDIARYGRLIEIKINAFSRVETPDAITADGVIHVLPNVLVPPKTPGSLGESADGMELAEFKERLEPFVGSDDTGPRIDL